MLLKFEHEGRMYQAECADDALELLDEEGLTLGEVFDEEGELVPVDEMCEGFYESAYDAALMLEGGVSADDDAWTDEE